MRRFITLVWAVLVLAGCNLNAETPVPTPDLPTVTIVQPENQRQVFEGVNVDILIEAEDDTVGISRVELYIDNTLAEDFTIPNYQVEEVFSALFNWQAQGVGRHVIQVIAYRAGDVASRPATIEIVVIPREGEGTPEITPEVTEPATP